MVCYILFRKNSERIIHKGYDRKGSVETKSPAVSFKGLGDKTVNRQSRSKSDSDCDSIFEVLKSMVS
jgi:hypothetical protein